MVQSIRHPTIFKKRSTKTGFYRGEKQLLRNRLSGEAASSKWDRGQADLLRITELESQLSDIPYSRSFR